MFDSLRPPGLQHARLPYPSLSPGVCSNLCPLSWWCYLTISSSAILFSFCLQSSPASGSFLMGQLFVSRGQNIGDSASAPVIPMNIQGWFNLGLIDLISVQCKGLSRVFSHTTIQKHQFFVVQSLRCVRLLATSWPAPCQASLTSTLSQSLLKFMSIELVMLSNHLILCCPLLHLPSLFPPSGSLIQW